MPTVHASKIARARNIPVNISFAHNPTRILLYRRRMFSILDELCTDGIHDPNKKGPYHSIEVSIYKNARYRRLTSLRFHATLCGTCADIFSSLVPSSYSDPIHNAVSCLGIQKYRLDEHVRNLFGR